MSPDTILPPAARPGPGRSALLALLLARCLDKRVEDRFSLGEKKS
jgi:hypothetical protein